MYFLQQIFTVVLTLFGIASLRVLIRRCLPNIKEWHLDFILGFILIIVLIINWMTHDQDTKQILQLQVRTQSRSINRTQKLIDELCTNPRRPIYIIADDFENDQRILESVENTASRYWMGYWQRYNWFVSTDSPRCYFSHSQK